MKTIHWVIFLSVALTVYSLINLYIFYHGWQALPSGSIWRSIYWIVFLLLAISYIIGRFLERLWASPVVNLFTWIGSFWLAAMIYFLLILLLLDLLRLLNYFLPFFPAWFRTNYVQVKLYTFFAVIATVVLVIIVGFINARHPKVTTLDLKIHKRVNGLQDLNIVAVSDIHLGALVGARHINKLAAMVNALSPDIVLFAGDMLDEDMRPERCKNICSGLSLIQPQHGIFAVPGNHEYYVGLERARQYLQEHNVTLLTDSVINIADKFWLVGRHDMEKRRFTGEKRLELSELCNSMDNDLPIILLDHQPLNLAESVANKVDLQISGHTHHGQLWPFNYLTRRFYEVSYGYKLKDTTHIYVSAGYGTWGPPIRTNTRPEIVHIRLHFE